MGKDSDNNPIIIIVATVAILLAAVVLYLQFRPKNYAADATSAAPPGASVAKPGLMGKPMPSTSGQLTPTR